METTHFFRATIILLLLLRTENHWSCAFFLDLLFLESGNSPSTISQQTIRRNAIPMNMKANAGKKVRRNMQYAPNAQCTPSDNLVSLNAKRFNAKFKLSDCTEIDKTRALHENEQSSK